jgi:hypothetical protein
LTSMFWTMYEEKNWNIVLTMHISDFFQTIKRAENLTHIFQMWNRGLTFKTQIVRWNQALNTIWKCEVISPSLINLHWQPSSETQRWKSVQILQIHLCYFSLAVLIFWLYTYKKAKDIVLLALCWKQCAISTMLSTLC